MPFEIRMNMFLVKCGEINNLLCEECENLIDIILNKVGDHVFVKMAPDISQSVKTIQDELAQQAIKLANIDDPLEAADGIIDTKVLAKLRAMLEGK